MVSMPEPHNICIICKHYNRELSEKYDRDCCDAFPRGIPGDILVWGFDHREPYPNDNGICFELVPNVPEEAISYMNEQIQHFSKKNNESILEYLESYKESHNGEYPYEYGEDDEDYEDYDDDEGYDDEKRKLKAELKRDVFRIW